MTMKPFTTIEALEFGWNTLRAHLAPLLILGGAGLMLGMLSQALGRGGGALLGLVIQAFQVALWLVLTRAALRFYDGETVDLSEPRPLLQGFWVYLLCTFVFGVLTALGFVLLIVPGVLIALTYGFAPFLAAEGQKDLAESFRESKRLTRGVKGPLFVLGLALFGLNLLGLLALGVGVVATLPMSALSLVYAYRRLQGRTEVVTHHPPAPVLPRMTPHH